MPAIARMARSYKGLGVRWYSRKLGGTDVGPVREQARSYRFADKKRRRRSRGAA
ncbi:hypothetical protein ACNFIA_12910 [Pseudomonas sp. NY15437]|uniref:hypothetical protein n=1 Tax=Pseudomonas sp. NY15437 TaxID=3400360 RepID=UPI003A89353B